jgi:hypothetical protein
MTTQDAKSGAFVNDSEHWGHRAEAMRVLAEDRKKQEVQAREDFLLDVVIAVLLVGMVITLALICLVP